MRRVIGLGAVLLTLGAAQAKQIGDWSIGSGQGYIQYMVTNESGDEFAFSCDDGASVKGETKKTNLYVTINGEAPPADSSYTVTSDAHELTFYFDEKNGTDTTCKVCSENFIALWQQVRMSTTVTVKLSDKRSATFRVNGAAKALPRKHCTTGYESL